MEEKIYSNRKPTKTLQGSIKSSRPSTFSESLDTGEPVQYTGDEFTLSGASVVFITAAVSPKDGQAGNSDGRMIVEGASMDDIASAIAQAFYLIAAFGAKDVLCDKIVQAAADHTHISFQYNPYMFGATPDPEQYDPSQNGCTS